jgi:Putative beta barrel porin-7 (BBP7)
MMRLAAWSVVAGCLLAGAAVAQPVPPVLPPPAFAEGPSPPADSSGGAPSGSEVIPGVRPPMPVSGAPIEIPCGPMIWTQVDYLLWRAKGGLVPPLVVGVYTSANPPLPTDPRMAFPVSDDRINGDLKSGYRLGAGVWIDKPNGTGIEAIYSSFLSTENTNTFVGGSNVILARPFVDVVQRNPSLLRLSDPAGTMRGIAQVRSTFDSNGAELNVLPRGPAMIGEEMHWILGVRYSSLEENLTVAAASTSNGLSVSDFDSFTTRNRFYGPQVGGNWHWDRDRLGIDFTLKMAIGGMTQETSIDGGSTAMFTSGARLDRPGGLLALQSNIGDFNRTKLAWVRDTSLGLTYRVMDNVQLRLGYEFFWVSSVLRPGQQIDLGVNPTLLPFNGGSVSGPIRPWYKPDGEIFWMHGVNVGVAVQF